VILDNYDLDKTRAGCHTQAPSGEVDAGRIELDASLHDSFPNSELASAPTDSINASGQWYDVEEGRYVEEIARDLGLTRSTACLLLPRKPNHYKIRPTSKVLVVSLEARQWSLRSTPSPSLLTAAMMVGQMGAWLNWRKNWGSLWESNKWSHTVGYAR
jgi:hypothetical protein